MPPPKKSTPEQLEFLISLVPLFRQYQQKKMPRLFFPLAETQWFDRWPEWKQLFDGDVMPVLTEAETKEYQTAIFERKQRLKNWFNNYKGDLGRKAMRTKPLSAWLVDMVTRPRGQRAPQLAELYSHHYYTTKVQPVVRAYVQSRLEAGETIEGYLSIVKRLTRECFENETDEIKNEIEAMREIERSALAMALEDEEHEQSNTPESYKRSLDDFPAVIRQLIAELHRRTGWCITVMAGGPDPSDGGAIRVMSVHAGVGESGHNYAKADPNFSSTSMNSFIRFVKSVFPKEIRITRALGYVPPPSAVLGDSSQLGNEVLTSPADLDTTTAQHMSSADIMCVQSARGSGTTSAATVPDSTTEAVPSSDSLSIIDVAPATSDHVLYGPFAIPQEVHPIGTFSSARTGSDTSVHVPDTTVDSPLAAPALANLDPPSFDVNNALVPPLFGGAPGIQPLNFFGMADISAFTSAHSANTFSFAFSDPSFSDQSSISAAADFANTTPASSAGSLFDLDLGSISDPALVSDVDSLLMTMSDAEFQAMSSLYNVDHDMQDGFRLSAVPEITTPVFLPPPPVFRVDENNTAPVMSDHLVTPTQVDPGQGRPRRITKRPPRPDEAISIATQARERELKRSRVGDKENIS
ncbi:hypothetical protein CERSUDRAFT_100966 [Gelatoporia subvermispora B]|uniref:Uncharacterized protein n=1 Tax=Ceriporiopsis subvermispora (strain B) TaxID=914234 RepID=M2P6B7_CERS8|nr:hypothetical protein CERSUDRAFT_100966 [Gelatoporia subvermispora B]